MCRKFQMFLDIIMFKFVVPFWLLLAIRLISCIQLYNLRAVVNRTQISEFDQFCEKKK